MSRFCATLAALLWLSHFEGIAAQSPCDPALPTNQGHSGYQQREDRCEGKYKRQVASFGVQLVSLTGALPLEDLCTGEAVHLVWPAHTGAGSQAVHLQVESLRPNLEYRLNTDRPPRSSSFEWPSNPRCNEDVRLRSRELAAVARTVASIGSKPVTVLLPVTVAAQATALVRPPYRAVLMPGRRIQEVYVSLWHSDDATNRAEVIRDRPLGMRPYPAGVQIAVDLTAADVKKPGLYRLLISAEFENGQVETIERYFLGG